MEYFEPKSINEAVSLLAKHGTEAKIIAGGTDVMVDIKYKEEPAGLMNIKRIPGLSGIQENGGGLGIGASIRLAPGPQHRDHRRQYLPRLAFGGNPDAAAGPGSQRSHDLLRQGEDR